MFMLLLCFLLSSCEPNLSSQDLDGLCKKAAQIEVLNELLSDHVHPYFFRKIQSLIGTKLKRKEKKKANAKKKESEPGIEPRTLHSQSAVLTTRPQRPDGR